MAKVTITLEDIDNEVDIKTHFEPKPPTNPKEFTNAQDAAFFLLDQLTDAEQCKEVIVNGNRRTTMKAYGKRVLIKPDPVQEMSRGGIVLPKSAQEKDTITAKVINVGEEVETYLEVGDKILLFSGAGVSVTYDDEKYLLVSPENILAIL